MDVGALWTKMAVVEGGKVLATGAVRSTMKHAGPVKELADALMQKAGLPPGSGKMAATGVGRKNIAGAAQLTDLMAFSKGARFLHPPTRVIVDLGGQGVRLIELDADGVMSNFTTNDKCSTGTVC